MDENSEPVKVFVRVRPELDDLQNPIGSPLKQQLRAVNGVNCITAIDEKSIKLIPPDGVYGVRKNVSAVDDKIYTFDRIFAQHATQEEIYDMVSEHVQATVRGYNTTIFAYGCTGSGKSYTMTGNKLAPGIIPRAIGDIFHQIETIAKQESDVYFLVRLSYVELYNNSFRNLLENTSREQAALQATGRSVGSSQTISGFFPDLDDNDSSLYDSQFGPGPSFAAARSNSAYPAKIPARSDKIEVRESSTAGVFLSGANLRITVTNALEAFQLIAKGNKVRAVGATNCNESSSRSHAILTFHVESRTVTTSPNGGAPKSELRLGKIHLVDLAGSERLKMSEAEGDRLLETQNINLSLTSLGDVLAALSKNATVTKSNLTASASKKPVAALAPVPYRNSKLTHLLKDSLGGNSKTIMITNVRTTAEYFSQTLISLDWSSRAKKVRNKSLVNRNVIGDTGIQQISAEMERLMARIDERTVEFEKLKLVQMKDARENVGLKNRLQELQNTNEKERKLLEQQVSQVIHSQAGHIQSQRQKIAVLQSALQDELTMSQNVIAEQEKEIKWLKKALDDTVLASEDKDQTQRMQQAIDSWQSRAKSTHQELSTVLVQAEELRTLNVEMSTKIQQLEATNRDLSEEVDERTAETVQLTNALSQLLLEKQENEKISAGELKNTLEGALDRETKQMNKISALEGELRSLKDFTDSERLKAQQHVNQLTKRVTDMERDKAELTSRLTTTISALEKKTTQVVEDANHKLVQKDSQLKDSEIQQQIVSGEVSKLKSQLAELLDLSELKIASRDTSIAELETALNRELAMNNQQSTQILSLQTLVEGFKEKINKLKAKLKDTESHLTAANDKHIAEFNEWVKEQNTLKAANEKERATLVADLEATLVRKKAEHEKELERATKDWARVRQQIEDSHHAELESLYNDLTAKDLQMKKKVAETELRVNKMITEGISALEAQHSLNTSNLAKDRAKAQEEALAQQKALLESLHVKELEQAKAEADFEKQSALEQAKRAHEAALAKLRADHEQVFVAQEKAAKKMLIEKVDQVAGEAKAARETTVTDLLEKHEKAMSKAKGDHAAAIQNLQKKYDELLAKSESDFESSLGATQQKYEAELRRVEQAWVKAKADHEEALHKQQRKFEDLLAEKGDQLNVETSARLKAEALASKVKADAEAASKEQQLHYEHLLNEKSTHLVGELRRHEEVLHRTRTEADLSLASQAKAFEAQLSERVDRLTEDTALDKAKAVEDLKRKHQREIERMAADHDENLNFHRRASEKNLLDKLEFLSVEKEIASQSQLDDLKQKYEQKMFKHKAEWELALAQQAAAAEKLLAERLEHAAEDAKVDKQKALDDLKRKHERQLDALNSQNEESLGHLKKISDSLMSTKVEQVSADIIADKDRELEDQKRRYELLLTKLKSTLEEDGLHSLEVLRNNAEEEKRQLVRELKQQHEVALASQRADFENQLLRQMEDAVASGENERKYALFALEKKNSADVDNLNAKYQLQIQALEKQLKKQEGELTRKFELERESIENAHRENQIAQDKKILLYKASMEERTNETVSENSKRLEAEHRAKVEEVSRREKDQLLRHAEALKAADDKAHADLVAAVEKERALLTERHRLEVETLRADSKVALQRALLSTESKHNESLSEQLESERQQLSDTYNRRILASQEEARKLLEDSLAAQKLDSDNRYAVDLQALRNKMTADQFKSESELRASHAAELDVLVTKHRLALETQRRDLETELHLTQDGKDKVIAQLRDQLIAVSAKAKEELTSALEEQRAETFERQRAELERFRVEKHETELRHQEDLSNVLADHLAELAKQRKNLEASHSKTVTGLQDDLTATKDKLFAALSQVSTSEGEGNRQLLEQKMRFDDQLRSALADADASHRREARELSEGFDAEVQKLREANERLRSKSGLELEAKAREYREEVDRQVLILNNKFAKEIADLKAVHESALSAQLANLSSNHSAEANRVRDEYAALKIKAAAAALDADNRVAALNEALAAQVAQFEEYKVKTAAEHKERLARMEAKYLEDHTAAESNREDLDGKLKARHRQVVTQLKEEHEAELQRAREETKSVLIKRDESYQNEIAVLKGALTKRETDYRVEASAVEAQLIEAKKKSAALQSELTAARLDAEVARSGLKEEHAKELADLTLAQKRELQRVHAEWAEKHNAELDQVEAQAARSQQEFRFQTQLIQNECDQAKMDLSVSFKEKTDELHEALAAERVRLAQVKQTHSDELQSLHNRYAAEKRELQAAKEEAIRSTVHLSDAEATRQVSELKERHAAELASAAAKLEAEKRGAVEQLNALSADFKLKLRALEDKHKEAIDNHDLDIQSHRDSFRRTKDTHSASMLDLEKQLEGEKTALVQSYEDSLKAEARRRETEMKRLREQYAAEVEDLQQRADAEVQFLRERLAAAEREGKDRVREVENTTGEQLNNLLNLLDKERALVRQLKDEHHVNLVSQDSAHKERLSAKEGDAEKRCQALLEKMDHQKEEHRRVVESRLAEQKETLNQAHQAALNALFAEVHQSRSGSDKAVRDLERDLVDAKEEIAKLQSDLHDKSVKLAEEGAYLREKSRKDLEAERARITESFNQTLQLNTHNARGEIAAHEEELKAVHRRELELQAAQFKNDLHNALALRDKEADQLVRRSEAAADEVEDLKRQLVKANAVRDSLTADLDAVKTERSKLRDSVNSLEIEVIDHGKAKFESRLLAERDKIDRSYQQAFAEVKAEVGAKMEEIKALQARLAQGELDSASTRAVARFAEEERDRVEAMFKTILTEREAAHEVELRHALENQHDELQGGYLKLIQQQVDSLMLLIQRQSTQHSSAQQVDDLQNRFMTLVQDLPDLWKQKHGSFMGPSGAASAVKAPVTPAKTPLFLLTGNSQHTSHGGFDDHVHRTKAQNNGSLPWSSPSLRSSPTDQLIAAILDGDVQGIRAVVRAKGDDLTSDFWRDLSKSVLPLHRAVSGLHFHGSEKLLVSTIEALSQLGADVNATDHAGNSVLHKAIQVCTSKSVAAVVQTLLMRGANASLRNKDGDSPLHSECKRVRTASVEVVEALISAGADPNAKNQHNSAVTPLTLVLLRGASSTVVGAGLIGQGEEAAFGLSGALLGRGLDHGVDADSVADYDSYTQYSLAHSSAHGSRAKPVSARHASEAGSGDHEKNVAGRRVWIKAAEMLIKSGAHWDSAWRTPRGDSQLHLFLAAFPPTREDSGVYRSLLKSALEHGLNPAIEDSRGRSALFVLCEQMSHISSDACPDSTRLVQTVLDASGPGGFGGTDRSGRSILDIEEKVPHSCLSACRHQLATAVALRSSRATPLHSSKDWEFAPRAPNGSTVRASANGSLNGKAHYLSDSFSSANRHGISHFQDSTTRLRGDVSLSTPMVGDPVKKQLSASYLEEEDEAAPAGAARQSQPSGGSSRYGHSTYLSRK